jgi:hypothetical protein
MQMKEKRTMDQSLIFKVENAKTGADIHMVNQLLSNYKVSHILSTHPEVSDRNRLYHRGAIKETEIAMRKFVSGVPIRKCLADLTANKTLLREKITEEVTKK